MSKKVSIDLPKDTLSKIAADLLQAKYDESPPSNNAPTIKRIMNEIADANLKVGYDNYQIDKIIELEKKLEKAKAGFEEIRETVNCYIKIKGFSEFTMNLTQDINDAISSIE